MPNPTQDRLELSVSLNIENTRMILELWRMTDNSLQVEVEENENVLTAVASTTSELETLINRALSLIKQVK